MVAILMAIIIVIAVIAGALYLTLSDGSGEDESIYYTTIAPSNMKIALDGGNVAGYIAWEPYCSDSIVAGVGEALVWSGEIKSDHPCCVVLVSNNFLSSSNGSELTARFLKAHMEATDWINDALSNKSSTNYTALMDMAVAFTSRNSSVVGSAFEHVNFDYAITQEFIDAMVWFTESFIEIGVMTNASLTDRGYTSTEDFAENYVNESHIGDAIEVLPSDTIIGEVRLGFLTGDLHQMAQVVARNESFFGGKSPFEKYGISISVATGAPYVNGPSEMDNFAQGNVDIGYLGAPPAILKHINYPGVQAQIVAQVNTEGSALIVSPGIQSLEDLKGKTIAIPGTGTIQYLLLQVLIRDAGIELKAA